MAKTPSCTHALVEEGLPNPTNAQLRVFLGHNGHECRVRISRDGNVYRHGSPDPFDRLGDGYWVWLGTLDELQYAWRIEVSYLRQPLARGE